MPDTKAAAEQERAAYRRASEYLNDATCHLQETGMSHTDTLITVLYEAASLVEDLHRAGPPSKADMAAVADALGWLSDTCATALVQAPASRRRDQH